MGTFVTFGEALLRLSPPGHHRLGQPGSHFELGPAGAELNVACALSTWNNKVRYVTALPADNPLADQLLSKVKSYGVDTEYVVRRSGRVGLVFVETGASQRPSRVHYDRSHSSMSLASFSEYEWEKIFSSATHLHITGITPALSENAAHATIKAAKYAKQSGLHISCDLNFRSKLWQWSTERSGRALAEKIMREILPEIDLLIANETDLADVLGIRGETAEGAIDIEVFARLARQAADAYPNLSYVAITLRESLSASHNRWGALLLERPNDQIYFAPENNGVYAPYDIDMIIDRVGAGDAFAAGLLHALTSDQNRTASEALDFAVAASCLAHSIPGDINHSKLGEIQGLTEGNRTGRVVR